MGEVLLNFVNSVAKDNWQTLRKDICSSLNLRKNAIIMEVCTMFDILNHLPLYRLGVDANDRFASGHIIRRESPYKEMKILVLVVI